MIRKMEMIIDTHSHLFDDAFTGDVKECIKRAKDANVNKIVLVGFSRETNDLAINYAKEERIFYPTAGLHPSEASENYLADLAYLEDFICRHKVYAIGECGLDYHWVSDNKELQKSLFKGQLDLALKYNLPVIVHMRDATLDTYEVMKPYGGKIRGVMHCYSGSLEMAKEFIKLGFLISLGGPVTFKNAKESKKVAAGIPMDKLLVETDCPYLAPTPYRGLRNESSYVVKVVEEIACLRNMSVEEVEIITTQNAIDLFKLDDYDEKENI